MQIFSNKRSLKNAILLFCSVLTLSLAGCKDDEEEQPTPEPQPVSLFAIYQASPDAPELDILVGNQKINNQPFRFTNYSNYLEIKPGNYRFRFNPLNAANSYIDSTLTFEDNKVYSMFTVGRAQNLRLLVVQDEIKAPATGKVSVRFVNLSPDAPNVDVVTTGTNGTTLFSNIPFKHVTTFTEVTAGTHSFQIRRAGTQEVLVTVNNQDLQAGRVNTFLLRGFQTPPSGNTNNLNLEIIRNL